MTSRGECRLAADKMNVCSAVDFPDLGPPWITMFPADDVASKISGSRRISNGLSISPSGQRHCRCGTPGARQHRGQRNRLVQRRQPQLRRPRPVAGQLFADGRDQLARRPGRLFVSSASEITVSGSGSTAPAVNSLGSGISLHHKTLWSVCGGS